MNEFNNISNVHRNEFGFQANSPDKDIPTRDLNQGLFWLGIIEQLMDSVVLTDEPAFTPSQHKLHGPILRNSRLSRYYDAVKLALLEYRDGVAYSVKVDEFYAACRDVRLLPSLTVLGSPMEIHLASRQRNFRVFNELMVELRKRCNSSRYSTRLKRQERNSLRRVGRVLIWEREMFQWRSRHLFLVLTLTYLPEFHHRISLEVVQEHLHRLLNNRRSNALLGGIDGYVAKIEEGDKGGGLHVHLVIAYAPVTQDDIGVAKAIGEYWRDRITQGLGNYWNSNADKGKHARWGHGVGTGKIDHFNEGARKALRINLGYLAKPDQHLRRKASQKTKTFWMSQPPEKSSVGRPRLIRMNDAS